MREETRILHLGRNPVSNHGIVNPPVYHLSTVLFPTLDSYYATRAPTGDDPQNRSITYGTHGSPSSIAFERAIAELEGGHACFTYSSGLAALAVALLSCLRSGDQVLVADSVYYPTRRFCDGMLARLGIETVYYPPGCGAGIQEWMTGRTRAVYVESPGSMSFEVQDVPAIAEQARAGGAKIIVDNTWATPAWFKPFEHGADLSIQAATKYIAGHSDLVLGTVTANRETVSQLEQTTFDLGQCAGPDDIYLAARGLRTMMVRLARHQENARIMAEWLQARPEVKRVLYPALPGAPGHDLWRRDFLGATGLFSIILEPMTKQVLSSFIDGLELFGLGASWGGFESLVMPADLRSIRTAQPWTEKGTLVRLHIGLEHVEDLQADLEAGLQRIAAAR